jgi:hypothetical protein
VLYLERDDYVALRRLPLRSEYVLCTVEAYYTSTACGAAVFADSLYSFPFVARHVDALPDSAHAAFFVFPKRLATATYRRFQTESRARHHTTPYYAHPPASGTGRTGRLAGCRRGCLTGTYRLFYEKRER